MDSVRWGVLGVADIAVTSVIPAIQRARNGRMVAIASRNPSRAEEAAHRQVIPRSYGTYEALLNDPDVQAIYIPLPNSLHYLWTLRCAEAGKHVLCEKPLALSAKECAEMVAACRQNRVVLMEGFMYRFHPRTERVIQTAADGTVGNVRLVRCAHTFLAQDPRSNIRFQSDLGGGALYDTGCYTVNLCRTILGEPEEVFAWGRFGRYGVDEQVSGLLRFGSGRFALIDCSLALPARQEWEIVGTEGRLSVTGAFLPGTRDTEIQLTHQAESTSITIPGTDQYQRMVEHFGDVTQSRTMLRFPPEDAIRNLRVIEALHRALRSGRPERVDH
jgi:D-xylose 1-dehydrogenase (NADP+, D-xylono-1,5-lactone-forming)